AARTGSAPPRAATAAWPRWFSVRTWDGGAAAPEVPTAETQRGRVPRDRGRSHGGGRLAAGRVGQRGGRVSAARFRGAAKARFPWERVAESLLRRRGCKQERLAMVRVGNRQIYIR